MFRRFLQVGKFSVISPLFAGFCVICALLCIFAWRGGASRFSNSIFFGYVAGFMCDLCYFVNICMVWWRVTVLMWCFIGYLCVILKFLSLKQFLEKETNTNFSRLSAIFTSPTRRR